MKLDTLLTELRSLAPESLAEGWDKVGLHVGDPTWDVRRALLCIDLTAAVLAEAIDEKADLVVAYHPPIFKPLDRLTTLDAKQAIILEAARKGIAVYSPHTALDAAEGGVNDFLAYACDPNATSVRPIRPTAAPSGRNCKLVTFVPSEHAGKVRDALAAAGAGRIGDYSRCSFSSPGEGTFEGSDQTNPAVGKAGNFERVSELRMEMVCPASALLAIVDALRSAHPYEEPAFDIYPLETPPPAVLASTGQGRIVTLSKPTAIQTLATRLKKALGVKHLDIGCDVPNQAIEAVGLCAGAGGSLLDEAGRIDLFFTGEMRHHDVLAARAKGVAVILAGHTQTERPYLPVYCSRATGLTGKRVSWVISSADQPPSVIR